MGFSNNPQRNRILVSLSNGKFKVSNGRDQEADMYDSFEGVLTGIRYRDREDLKFADLEFADGDKVYAISVLRESNGQYSTLFVGIMRVLIQVKDFSKPLQMQSWQVTRGEGALARTYTNVSIAQDGQKIRWDENDGCPNVEIREIEGQKIAIYGPRKKWIDMHVEALNKKLHESNPQQSENHPQTAAAPAGGYLPAEEQYYDPSLNDMP